MGYLVQLLLVALYMSTYDDDPFDAKPPAKNTNPDTSDAAAKQQRASPRPSGYVDQLLLVALYRSMYEEGP